MSYVAPGVTIDPSYSYQRPIPDDVAYWLARHLGFDDDGARSLIAVLYVESARGVIKSPYENSYGPLQFYETYGQLAGYAAYLGLSQIDAGYYAALHQEEAIAWALNTYLGRQIVNGQAAGLAGSDLATFIQRYGQISVNPETAGQMYDLHVAGVDYGPDPFAPAEPLPDPEPVPVPVPPDNNAGLILLGLLVAGAGAYVAVRGKLL